MTFTEIRNTGEGETLYRAIRTGMNEAPKHTSAFYTRRGFDAKKFPSAIPGKISMTFPEKTYAIFR